ncbi:S8 family serine peptidase [Microbispora sp. RL4-1S]|uniref:S8 family serine peptidase n=1 Tax=Microbispora oryzae TaxID=2806554 RepID=A0A940WW71_9ACTN|nr:S8 family serine peptidase [Microbispora oryzae]MBP2708540.1 S8 family serine peptidase [Microbispora oryzae]
MHRPPPLRRGFITLSAGLTLVLAASPLTGGTASAASPDPAPGQTAAPTAASSTPAASAATAANGPSGAVGAAGGTRTVTLITGDKVTYRPGRDAPAIVSIQGPQGRRAAARVTTVGHDVYVLPDAATPYVDAGLLDRSLFDVTQLVADGYDDASSDHIPLIVTYTDAAARKRAEAVPSGAEKVRTLSSIQGAALSAGHDRAADFWSSLTGAGASSRAQGSATAPAPGTPLTGGIAKVWLDGKAKADLADTVAQVRAPEVWAKGNTGTGVKVAVLDTGVDAEHPDLKDRITQSATFVPGVDVTDRNGHGTHVASTIAGTGAASDGLEKGVAPSADLLIGKVLDNSGSGQDSWIIAGMEWAARDQKAKVISMSLGAGPTDGTDPLSQAVNRLSEETGALFTIAAGNSGPEDETVSTPAVADSALAVAAVSVGGKGTALAAFSSRGPRVGDYGLKPEISAPGVDVLAARSQYAPEGEGAYQTMSGTSMATPHVAGVAALLAAAHPDWTGQRLKDALVSTSKVLFQFTPYQVGGGLVDASAAVGGSVFATGTAYIGAHWPYSPGQRASRPVTYTNTGDSPVTLHLTVTGGAPQGLFEPSASSVTVPAHGTATVDVAVNLDQAELDSHLAARLDAADDNGVVRAHTVLGYYKEGERAVLTVHARDRSGRPLAGDLVVTRRLPDGHQTLDGFTIDESGTTTLRLPTGTYSIWMWGDVEGANGPHSLGRALIAKPRVNLTADTEVTLDASGTRRLSAVLPPGEDQDRTTAESRMDFTRGFGDGYVSDSTLLGVRYDSMWALPTGAKVTDGELSLVARWRDEQPRLAVSSEDGDFGDLLIQSRYTPLAEGRRTYDAVFAGQGSAAEFAAAKVAGRVAVVRWTDDADPVAMAEAARAAGAKLLLLVGDGQGRLDAWDAVETAGPLPVASVTKDEGERLIGRILKRGRAPLRVTSHPEVGYLYDLVHQWTGAVPADPVYRPGKRDLARVEMSFDNHRQDSARDIRTEVLADGRSGYGGYLTDGPARGTRTDWVSADGGVRWVEQALVLHDGVQERSDLLTYPGGRTSQSHWFGPVQRPRMNGTGWFPERGGDALVISVPSWGSSGGSHTGEMLFTPRVTQTISLYQGDALVERASNDRDDRSVLMTPIVSPDRLPYRLVNEAARDASLYPYSTRTLTEWNFTTGYIETDHTMPLPLIQVDYDVDLDSDGRAGRRADLTVTPLQMPFAEGAGTIKTVTVEVSYDDGTTWRKAKATRCAHGWTVGLDAPRGAGAVTLRTHAEDTVGNTVTQTVVRAFGLR